MSPLDLPRPYLLFLGDADDTTFLKTGLGLRDWAPAQCIAEYKCPGAGATLGLPAMRPSEAYAAGARAMLLSAASIGGAIPASWTAYLIEAIEAGLDIVSGAHHRLADNPQVKARAAALGRRLIDVRSPPADLPVATGRKRSGKRLLTVGTDCALGKKYTALALANAFAARGAAVDFRASGQTGIMIAGGGMPMDSIVSDFEAGAAELLSPDAAPDHWDVIEGQGSLLHPAYAAVSLGLLHGSQPDVFVVCHEPERAHLLGVPDYGVPSVEEIVALTIALGRRTNPAIRCAGFAYNTAAFDADTAARLMATDAERLGLPVADPIRRGDAFDRLVTSCLGAA